MKQFFLAVVCFLVLGGTGMSLESAKPGASAGAQGAEKVHAAEAKWLDAYFRLDAATLQSSESNDFTLIMPLTMITKQRQLSAVRERLSGTGLPGTPQTYTLASQTVRIYGGLALVTDVCTVSGGGAYPVTSPGRYWQTEVWRNEGGVWKIVHMHISSVEHVM